jgi:hypothetical protein
MPAGMQPGLSGGTPFPFSGGMGVADMGGGGFGGFGGVAGMGAAMGGGGDAGGGDMGGGGGGRGGGKVNMQAAMAMIPKPIQLPPLEGGIQPIKPRPPMPPDQGGGTSLAQQIMRFLQG